MRKVMIVALAMPVASLAFGGGLAWSLFPVNPDRLAPHATGARPLFFAVNFPVAASERISGHGR